MMSMIPIIYTTHVSNDCCQGKNSPYVRATSVNVLNVPFSGEETAGTFLPSSNGNAAARFLLLAEKFLRIDKKNRRVHFCQSRHVFRERVTAGPLRWSPFVARRCAHRCRFAHMHHHYFSPIITDLLYTLRRRTCV